MCQANCFGVTRGCPLVRGIPRFHGSLELVHQTWTHFFCLFFDCNFQPNDNQTFIVYVKSTLVLYRKGLCGFSPVLGFALEEKFYGLLLYPTLYSSFNWKCVCVGKMEDSILHCKIIYLIFLFFLIQ